MAWTEEQKEAARKELLRSRHSEESTARLAALLKAFALAVTGFLMATVGYFMFQDHSSGWWIRGNGMVLACIALAGAIVFSLRTYVRFREWRRALALENQRSLSS